MSRITSNPLCCTWVETQSMVFMVFSRCYWCIPLSHLLYLLYTLNHHKSVLSHCNFPSVSPCCILLFQYIPVLSLHHCRKQNKVTNFFSTIFVHFSDQKIGNVLGLLIVNSISVFWKKIAKFLHKIENKNHDMSVCYVCSRIYV
jgi:hypothetical protein